MTDHVERYEVPLHVSKYSVFQPKEEKLEYSSWKAVQNFAKETEKTEEVKVTTPKEVDTGAVATEIPVSEPIPQIDQDFDFSIYTKTVDDFFQKLKEKEEA